MEKKLGIMFFLFVAVVLLQFSELRTAQRPLQGDKQDEGNKNNNWAWARATQADKTSEMAQELSLLMGEEKCEERDDEECMKRRMITEAHLDYIYTQSHNKP